MTRPRFHLAIPVADIPAARAFYGELLGCEEGRSDEKWVDFNMFGHQVVTHLGSEAGDRVKNDVDGHGVPVPHFGVILELDDFWKLADRLKAAGTEFVIEPYTRFEGLPGEQATMFFRDPSGNALEFKAFRDDAQVFATE
ncbi:VOC family protein [Parvularcula marina]|uniref:Glyoxalase n=1 Tax=Parvularcula marina TaxID=2292771 RepID=A0A371RHQ2_9PROT|nr:VOC family protein [Parvularcula marina]RFB04987.1 glyoxalase [Parvularcula marina]